MKLKYISLALLAPSLLMAMESVDTKSVKRESSQKLLQTSESTSTQADVRLVLAPEQEQPELALELQSAIRSGRTNRMCALIAGPVTRAEGMQPQARSAEDIASALAFVNSSISTEQGKLVHSQLEQLFPRYKFALAPGGVTLGLLLNIALSAAQFDVLLKSGAATSLDKGGFAINMAASGLGAILAGHRTIKQIIKGWHDTRQAKAVEQLEDAQFVLTVLQKNGLNADGSIKPEYVSLIQKQQEKIAVLTLDAAQATADAANATEDANAAEAAARTKGKEDAQGDAPTRTFKSRDGSIVAVPALLLATEQDPVTQPETPVTREETVVQQAQPTAADAQTEAHIEAASHENAGPKTVDAIASLEQDAQVAAPLVATEDEESIAIEITPNPAYNPNEPLAKNPVAEDTSTQSDTSSKPAFTPSETLNAELDKVIAAEFDRHLAEQAAAREQAPESTELTTVAMQEETPAQEQAPELSDKIPGAGQETPATEDAKTASPVVERAKTPEVQVEAPAQEAVVEEQRVASPVLERAKTPEVQTEVPAQEAVVEEQEQAAAQAPDVAVGEQEAAAPAQAEVPAQEAQQKKDPFEGLEPLDFGN